MVKQLVLIVSIFYFTSMSMSANVSINYILKIFDPSAHYLKVEIEYTDIQDESLDLILPVWRPGRYFVFDFASGVQEFSACNGNDEQLRSYKTNKCTWSIETGFGVNKPGKVRISYKVYANEFNLRTRGLDEEHAFVDGTSVFMYSEKYRNLPLELEVIPYKNWHVTTGLENVDGNKFKFTAPNYDYFVDCPLEIGYQKDYTFDIQGKQHVISFFGEAGYGVDRLKNDLIVIIKKNYEFWGKIPYKRYVFIIHCTPQSGGGTEHINSTILGIKPSDFENEDSYKGILRLISHEFFHTWNVKQMRPKGITPYDYTKENYTEELWIAEGGTSYYDGLMLCRTSRMSTEDIFKEITKAVEEDRRRPGNLIQSLAESSFDAWIKFWKGNQQSYNAQSDYYKKGADVSLILDLEIRHRSENLHSLDDVYRTMFERFPLGTGYTNDDFKKICEELCGGSFDEVFSNYVYGVKPLEWEKYLSYAGLQLKSDDSIVTPVVGIALSNFDDKVFISGILAGSSAERAGLSAEDEIIAIDGIKADYKIIEKRLKELKKGEKVRLTVFKNDKLKEISLALQDRNVRKYSIEKTSSPAEMQKSIFEKWLGVKWQ
jgi:predicted metalloprotease with PDZ domain